MTDILDALGHWGLEMHQVRERMYQAPTPRERERWHALWLVAQGWSATKVEVSERSAHPPNSQQTVRNVGIGSAIRAIVRGQST